MSTKENINNSIDNFLEIMEELNPDALVHGELKGAIIGYIERIGEEPLIVYDRAKCLEILVSDGLVDNYEEALEYFEYNILGGYYGTGTPVFFTSIEDSI